MTLTKARILYQDGPSKTLERDVWISTEQDFSSEWLAFHETAAAEDWEGVYVPAARVFWFRFLENPIKDTNAPDQAS